MKVYLGVDPGKNGAITFLIGDKVICTKIPETERDLLEAFKVVGEHDAVALLEFVHSSPQMGVKSAFTFGQGYGALRMALTAAGIRWETVRPQEWQKGLGCLSKGDKNVTKARAQSLFPNVKVNHSNADSLLIAEFCRRKNL